MGVNVEVRDGVELCELIEKIIFENEENGCSISDLWKRLYEIVPQGQLWSRNVEEILNKLVVERKVKLWFPLSAECSKLYTVHFIPR
ncbi:MAG: hypothetical protein HYV51_03235 [Parcubacteria group bacterium]|nr:hypothetical protein [Parcubacteria group bacterium]